MMRGKRRWIVVLVFAAVLGQTPAAGASVILNEIFADPPAGLSGDANADGVRSSSADEFVELLNYGTDEVDLSGWLLSDSVSTRHIFPSGTVLAPYTFLAVFGGGAPALDDINWQTASTGSLGLNNSSDTVALWNAQSQLIDQVAYGSIGGKDQSITLFPDGSGDMFVLHSTAEGSGGALFSPGTSITSETSLSAPEEKGPLGGAVVPEPLSIFYLTAGLGGMFFVKRRR